MATDQPQKKNWLGRNWLWFIPVVAVLPVIVCCGGATLFVTLIFGAIKSSDVYTDALQRAQDHAEVKALLGEPIEAGFFVTGSINVSNTSGNADLTIPISGPKGSAIINAKATRTAGTWDYSTLEVVSAESEKRIDLRAKEKE